MRRVPLRVLDEEVVASGGSRIHSELDLCVGEQILEHMIRPWTSGDHDRCTWKVALEGFVDSSDLCRRQKLPSLVDLDFRNGGVEGKLHPELFTLLVKELAETSSIS